jgi:hypothetical protein
MGVLIEASQMGHDIKIINNLVRIMRGWLEKFEDRIRYWEIVAVEETQRLDFGDFEFAFTTDLIIKEGGSRKIIDIKFIYDFYTGDLLALLPQIPRYVGADRALGNKTTEGLYGFVRHRNLKAPSPDDLYQLVKLEDLTTERIHQAFRETRIAAQRIAELRKLDRDEWRSRILHVQNVFVCKSCPFKDLCAMEIAGKDSRLLRATEYEENKYGYAVAEES